MKPDVEAIDAAYAALPPSPRGNGRVDLIVLRTGGGDHATPERADVTVDGGVTGDRWSVDSDPERCAQVTLMMTAVARMLTGDRPLHLPGDNFLVDIDIGEEAMPAGTRIAIGSAILEISDEPHTGCAKFRERLGSAALRWVNHADLRHRRLRGVNCRVIDGGEVAIGDPIRVL
jgi:hypothetical protein